VTTFEVKNLEELDKVAQTFVATFSVPQTFVLLGEMGAGKTTFIKKICEALGASAASSPTFSLVNEYETKSGTKIFHFDLYRIKSLEEALDFGFEEYLDQNAYVFIEWPELVMPLLDEYSTIEIEDCGAARVIKIT
jgi:tRNA threonylcarbamoyladenosine biosynthesis protein TsaE